MKLLQRHHGCGIYFTVLLLTGIGQVAAATGAINQDRSRPVTKQVMTCEAPVEFRDRHRIAGLEVVPDPGQSGPAISLIRHSHGEYDVLVGNDSVTGIGRLSGMQGGVNPIHLVLETGSGTEHFLFMQNPDGYGELLWSSATASALTTCIAAVY